MTTLGFIFCLIGAFKKDKRFFVAGGICVAFDIIAILLWLVVMSLLSHFSGIYGVV